MQQMGWTGTGNGVLLNLAAEHECGALVTVDRGFEHQQNVSNLPIPVVIMIVSANRFQELQSLVPKVALVLNTNPRSGIYRVRD